MARTIELEPNALVLRYSGASALTRLLGELRVPYEDIRSVRVGLDEVPSALAFRIGFSTAPLGSTRQGQFWWAGKRLFLDFEDPARAVVIELKGNRFARVAVQPDTSPEELADKLTLRSGARPASGAQGSDTDRLTGEAATA
jgi:hypothetical protein